MAEIEATRSEEETREAAAGHDYGADVQIVHVGRREFILVGTAHISRESADLVRQVIAAEQPDCVCIELDRQRYAALSQQHRFEALDLRQIIRNQQLTTLMLNLILASYQQQLGGQLGVMPGTEFVEAAEVARSQDIPIVLCDRDVRVTLRRAWGALSAWRKFVLFGSLLGSVFDRPRLTEDDLRRLRQQDVGTQLIEELGGQFPALKSVLIDERDAYLAEQMRRSTGARVVAVIGAGHVPGIHAALMREQALDTAALETVPPVSWVWHACGWGIPLLVCAAIAVIGWRHGPVAAGHNAVFWILVTSIPSMLGAIVALGHPATVLSALLAAPITSLTPVLGAGHVAALVQVYVRPPRVFEFGSLAEEFRQPRRWWNNRVLQVLLVFVLVSLFGATGTLIASAKLMANLF